MICQFAPSRQKQTCSHLLLPTIVLSIPPLLRSCLLTRRGLLANREKKNKEDVRFRHQRIRTIAAGAEAGGCAFITSCQRRLLASLPLLLVPLSHFLPSSRTPPRKDTRSLFLSRSHSLLSNTMSISACSVSGNMSTGCALLTTNGLPLFSFVTGPQRLPLSLTRLLVGLQLT